MSIFLILIRIKIVAVCELPIQLSEDLVGGYIQLCGPVSNLNSVLIFKWREYVSHTLIRVTCNSEEACSSHRDQSGIWHYHRRPHQHPAVLWPPKILEGETYRY